MERKQITVKEVHEPRKFTSSQGKDLQVYSFTGTDGVKYQTLSDTIGKSFIAGKVLDADVETTTKGEYTNHNIKQLYEGGEPVSGKRKAWGGKSPEELKSIEQQVAVKAVVDLWIAGTISIPKSSLRGCGF